MSMKSDVRPVVYAVLLATSLLFPSIYSFLARCIFISCSKRRKMSQRSQTSNLLTFFIVQEESSFHVLWLNIHIHVICLIVKEQGCLPSGNTFFIIQLLLWCNCKLGNIELCAWITFCVASVGILRHSTILLLLLVLATFWSASNFDEVPLIQFWGISQSAPKCISGQL
jgi:hypothetical protein